MEIINKNGEKKNNVYPVSDFYLAAFLKARGLKLLETIREGRRVTFIFEDRADRTTLTKDFYNDGSVQVNPFIHAIQDLKSIIYNVPDEVIKKASPA